MLVRIISMVIAGVIIVYLVRWIDNFFLQVSQINLACNVNQILQFVSHYNLCGHFLILKQENRKSFLLAICGFSL